MELTEKQLDLVRQWFNAVQDLNPNYLEQQDYSLARNIYQKLGIRVPSSMLEAKKASSNEIIHSSLSGTADVNNNEEWYDKEVAPKLAELSRICENKGMAFIAVVEYSPNNRGTTAAIPSSAGTAMVMLNHCAKMGENIDGYIIGLRKWARENGVDTSGSIIMNQLDGKPL